MVLFTLRQRNKRSRRPLTDDQMRLDPGPVQHLQYPNAKYGSGSASNPDDEARGLDLLHADSFSMNWEDGRKESERYALNHTAKGNEGRIGACPALVLRHARRPRAWRPVQNHSADGTARKSFLNNATAPRFYRCPRC
jgi:hypothetical protein